MSTFAFKMSKIVILILVFATFNVYSVLQGMKEELAEGINLTQQFHFSYLLSLWLYLDFKSI